MTETERDDMLGYRVKTLEYRQAMSDFCTMFPLIEERVIEFVLRSNKGHVESTIDQLLQLNVDEKSSSTKSDLNRIYYTLKDDKKSDTGSSRTKDQPPMYSSVFSTSSYQKSDTRKYMLENKKCLKYKDWNPPLVGVLPRDFLRVIDKTESKFVSSYDEKVKRSVVKISPSKNSNSSNHSNFEEILDENKIAMLLKNEEFLNELQSNETFMVEMMKIMKNNEKIKSKKKLEVLPSTSQKALEEVSFKENLKYMSKSAKTILYDIARRFTKRKSYKSIKDTTDPAFLYS